MNQMTRGGTNSQVPTRRLADGNEIPLLGFGVWQVPDGSECVTAVRSALEAGYRHIDTAQAYGNEKSVGVALRECGIAREQIFVTTKFYPGKTDPVAELEGSLRRLRIDYVDLYIIHWPQGGPTWAWPAIERARELEYARSIGVSNFSMSELEQTISVTTSNPPVINQVQFSPFEFRQGLLDGCGRLGVSLESYSSLGTGRHLDDPTVTAVAKAVGRTPAQVLLRWCVQRDIPVLPKSTHKERIIENAALFDFALSDADMSTLDDLDATGRTSSARESQWWDS
jgi:diketogulonate reductase-like aldo/keto reductase